ncbi:peptide deformylase [Pikeienuella piscinae]|uniref:Peptide deformylase n=1 Tax=Pikeienuella piscinae TaxID=2748098 RepID=A0A7L5BXI5_9RHOB|nr:peptide deformylase [Pikeienuella piscinae]QIE57090.1 peptide deformylase [Pikeienuella piscinae]
MSILPILIHPDPRLKRVCDPVADPASVAGLIEDMFQTMYDAPGIGLAAAQVGVNARVLVMDCAGKEEEPDPVAMINPEILEISEEMNEHEEGCLSIPEQYAMVARPAEVVVRWTTPSHGTDERRFDGLRATCVQHEIDHLDGRLFIDHIGSVRRQMITQKMKKLKRERAKA